MPKKSTPKPKKISCMVEFKGKKYCITNRTKAKIRNLNRLDL